MTRLWKPRRVGHYDESANSVAVEIEQDLYTRVEGSIMVRVEKGVCWLVVSDEADCAVLPMTLADCQSVITTLQRFMEERVNVRSVSNDHRGAGVAALGDREVA